MTQRIYDLKGDDGTKFTSRPKFWRQVAKPVQPRRISPIVEKIRQEMKSLPVQTKPGQLSLPL